MVRLNIYLNTFVSIREIVKYTGLWEHSTVFSTSRGILYSAPPGSEDRDDPVEADSPAPASADD